MWCVVLGFLLLVWLINPLRDMAKDDDWAYALTVRHLLETGRYQLHGWVTANPPAQIYLGALFSRLFGFSFVSLRLSTLTLLGAGLIAFYHLLRDYGSDDAEAALFTMILLASPLVMLLGFSFMTDVPFMAWVTMALWLYARAIDRRDARVMFIASLCASCAILTRQFGIAIPGALLACALFDRRRAPAYAAGLALPLAAGLWQAWSALSHPTLAMVRDLGPPGRQLMFLADVRHLIVEVLWRVTVAFQFLGLFLLPLAPACLVAAARLKRSWLWAAYVVAGIAYGYWIRGLLMPSIGYNLASSLNRIGGLGVPLTIVTGVMAVAFGWMFGDRYGGGWRAVSPGERFVAVAFVVSMAAQLMYVQLIDEYLLPFAPLMLFVAARAVGPLSGGLRAVTAVLCVCMLAGSGLWTFVLLDRKEAFWKAAEALRAGGVAPELIYAGEWSYFQAGDIIALRDISPDRIKRSTYLVSDELFTPYQTTDQEWSVVDTVGYRWFDLKLRYGFVYRRK